MTSSACSRCLLYLPIALLLLAGVACSGGSTNANGSSSGSSSGPSDTLLTPDSAKVARDTVISLAWQANRDTVAGYVVYYGPTPDLATTAVSNLSVTSSGFDANAPAVSYNAGSDLRLKHGDNVCFRLRAYDGAASMSAWSDAACSVI